MFDHHRLTIERLRERFERDPEALALIVLGSVGRGDARADSDVDCCLVVTDAAYQRRQATGELGFSADDLAEYPHGQAGGIVVDGRFLHDVAERGPEPARFAFAGTYLAFSRIAGLQDTLERIPRYPEHERHEKLVSFVSQLPVHASYLELGEYSRNPYLLAQTAVELVLFGGRLILAHNRMLYPGRKWFMRELERAPDKPSGLLERARALVAQPTIAHSRAFMEMALTFQPWPQAPEGGMLRYQRDREQTWRHGCVPLADS
ncbi:MAG TPA: nucleotidyltransferase domain-containing protein [Roseiflexaceae bacterium]|nr:nucleotidyltransferase domain-containing protein [Roseiflexaceae bacterium]